MSTPSAQSTERIEQIAVAASMVLGAVVAAPTPAVAQDSETPAGADGEETTGEAGDETAGELQRSDQMQFDARLVRGERASGAVFLFERTARRLPSLVDKRETYLRDSVQSVLGDDWARQFDRQRDEAGSRTEEASDDSSESDLELSLTDDDASDGD